MLYALNVAPINGWETQFAAGAALQAMEVGGAGHLVMWRPSGAADMAMEDAGDAHVALLGGGDAEMAVDALGVGYAQIHGIAWDAGAELLAIGEGTVIPFMGGLAVLRMTASGFGIVALLGAGKGEMQMSSDDGSVNTMAALGSGDAEMVLSGEYGIPGSAPAAGSYDAAMRLRVERDRTTFRVDPEPRERVALDGRLLRVSNDRSA